jgi:hypothetical protein
VATTVRNSHIAKRVTVDAKDYCERKSLKWEAPVAVVESLTYARAVTQQVSQPLHFDRKVRAEAQDYVFVTENC